MRRLTPIAFAAAIASATLGFSVAQEPSTEPEKLVELRAIYHRERDALRLRSLKDHVERMVVLEGGLRLRGDKPGADEVKAKLKLRRLELSALTKSESAREAESVKAKEIVLRPFEARITGSLKRSSETISNWTTAASGATWAKTGLPPGRYDIFLDYFPVPGGGGKLEVKDLHQTAIVAIPPGGETPDWTTIKAATFEFKSSTRLKVASTGRGRNGIFFLRAVRLVPSPKRRPRSR